MISRAIDHSRESLRGGRGLQGQIRTGSDRMTTFSLREGGVCSVASEFSEKISSRRVVLAADYDDVCGAEWGVSACECRVP